MSAPNKAFHNTIHLVVRIYPGPGRARAPADLPVADSLVNLSICLSHSLFPEWSGLVVYSLRGTRACRVASVDGRGGRAFAWHRRTVIARVTLAHTIA